MPLQEFPPSQTISNPVIPGGTQGNILFFGAGSTISQSSALFWDNPNTILTLGPGGAATTPQSKFGYIVNPANTVFTNGADQFRLGEGRPLGNPTGTPTAVTAGGGLTGTYKYAYVEMDQSGNLTGLSPTLTVVAAANQYTVTVPYSRAGVLNRILCRTKANGSTYYQLHNFLSGDNYHQTKFVDNTADGSLTVPIVNTDSTMLYRWVSQVNSQFGGIFLCSHPDQGLAYAADLTILTSDDSNGFKYAMDVYGTISASSARGINFYSRHTGTVGENPCHFLAGYLTDTDSGQNPSSVYRMNPLGDIVHSPFTTGVTNPTWYGLTGTVAGNYIVARELSSTSQMGIFVGAAGEPYFGSNINYSTGDTYSASITPPWKIGNAAASTTIPVQMDVAIVGTSGNAITWVNVWTTNVTGNVTYALPGYFASGINTAPGIAFSAETTLGIYRSGAGVIGFGANGTIATLNSTGFSVNQILLDVANQDVRLARDAADTLAQKRSSNAQTFRVYGTTTGPKYVSLSHNGTDATLDTAASSGKLILGGNATDIQWGKALVSLGGGAAPTLGTIGGSGPASAAQNSWMQVKDSAGNSFWVPAWK